jgi:hypothetical protein
MTQHVERVGGNDETLLTSECVNHCGNGTFKLRSGRDVDDGTTQSAKQMMVVFRQVFGQFEASELVTRSDATNDAHVLEINKVAIGGATWDVGELAGNVRDADRASVGNQQFNEGASSRGVAKITVTEASFDQFVNV